MPPDSPEQESFLSVVLRNKRWWLPPLVVALLLIALLVLSLSDGASPFVYSPF